MWKRLSVAGVVAVALAAVVPVQVPAVCATRIETPQQGGAASDPTATISAILGEINDRWDEIFRASGTTWTRLNLVLFKDLTNGGACGVVRSAMAPFCCASNRAIFVDASSFHSASRFAAAYLIAYEAGHHVQNLLGVLPRVAALEQRYGRYGGAGAEVLQLKMSLQADCLSGLWVNREENRAPGFLGGTDMDAALAAAAPAIGTDFRRALPAVDGRGTAEQRTRCFMTGYQQGTVKACNTFAAGAL
ncbi:MAG: neutral zinc metallopeptidase [Alphaproteobacteria bacterium]|nr:neutral zinc metallopeptidase [Alphaproteobacteria bacterium]